MITCESPAAAMRAARALGAELLDEHSHAFSRRDFALPRLFACRAPASTGRRLPRDRGTAPGPLGPAGGRRARPRPRPQHPVARVWRAFEHPPHLAEPAKMNRALGLRAEATEARGLDVRGSPVKPTALDGTCFESRHFGRHFGRHFEKPRRQTAERDRGQGEQEGAGGTRAAS